jgi:O-antigen/teichoic acid export membrane protein
VLIFIVWTKQAILMTIENNKRIAKNTLFLYMRMFLVMGVSLFTVRIILNALGVIDYGIYNVVGGITILFSFLSNTMAHASQRFFAYELGCNNRQKLVLLFKANMTIYAIISLIVIALTETVGLWFLNEKMQIPVDRILAAQWVYQFSIFAFIFSMFATPYKAVILAREKMSLFAYISIVEVFAKLLVAYLMIIISGDKLKAYAVFQFLVISGISITYILICRKKYKECRFAFTWNKQYISEICTYTSWSFYGHASMSLRSQGVNILLNLFFGPVVNTARGIAFQINAAITNFYMNFFQAVKPQIIKLYAQKNFHELFLLIYRSSRFCYYLMLIVSVPLLLETHYILKLWLGNVPEYVVTFTRITIITTLVDSITPALGACADATGKIRLYQLFVGTIIIMNIPLSWFVLYLGYPPEAVMYVILFISIVTLFVKLYLLKTMIGLSFGLYFHEVLKKIGFVTFIAILLPVCCLFFTNEGFPRFCLVTVISICWVSISVLEFGLTDRERQLIIFNLKSKIIK